MLTAPDHTIVYVTMQEYIVVRQFTNEHWEQRDGLHYPRNRRQSTSTSHSLAPRTRSSGVEGMNRERVFVSLGLVFSNYFFKKHRSVPDDGLSQTGNWSFSRGT